MSIYRRMSLKLERKKKTKSWHIVCPGSRLYNPVANKHKRHKMSGIRTKVILWDRGRRCIRSGCRHGFLGVIPQVGTTLAASSVLRVSRKTASEMWAQTRRVPSRYPQLAWLSDVVPPAQPGARRSEGGFSNDDQVLVFFLQACLFV